MPFTKKELSYAGDETLALKRPMLLTSKAPGGRRDEETVEWK